MQPSRLRRILNLSLPIMAAMLSQSLLNLVDTAMVGVLGDAALAAVGIGGFVVFASLSLVLGISSGVQALAARRTGEGRPADAVRVLNAGLLYVLLATPPLTVAMWLAAPWFWPLLNGDPQVLEAGVPYFQVRILAGVFVAMNYAFRGYWNAVELSRLYMFTLLVMHGSNVLLNYVLIYGHFGAPALGVTGAGLASSLSVVLGTAMYFAMAARHMRGSGFLRGLPPVVERRALLRVSVPSGVQQTSFLAAYIALFWIVGRVGTAELAAINVLNNIQLFAILPALGFGIASATLVGQALATSGEAGARRWARDTVYVTAAGMALLGAPMWLTPDLLLGIFIHESQTLELARLPLRIAGLAVTFEGIKLVLLHAQIGAGDAGRMMALTMITQWGVSLPLAWLAGPVLGLGLLGIWLSQEVFRFVQLAAVLLYWRRGRWARVQV